jgi:type IV secretion system protein VirB9
MRIRRVAAFALAPLLALAPALADEPGATIADELERAAQAPELGSSEAAALPEVAAGSDLPTPNLPDVPDAVETAVRAGRGDGGRMPATVLSNGYTLLPYGQAGASIECPVLTVCDLALDRGETVLGIALGDTERWSVEPAFSGTGGGRIQHAFIKAFAPDLRTNLILHTDQGRTYLVELRSSRQGEATVGPQRLSFYYPESVLAEWRRLAAEQAAAKAEAVRVEERTVTTDLARVNFSYKVAGRKKSPWLPEQIFDDGAHTFLRLPANRTALELPGVLAVGANEKQAILPNFRLVDGRWLRIDGIYREIWLTSGVGGSKDQIKLVNHDYPGGR